MRQGPGSFRRKALWRLLCGALGGMACAGYGRAADSPSAPAGLAVEAPNLRLTLTLNSARKIPRRPSSARPSGSAAESGFPLRMTLVLGSRPSRSPRDPELPADRAALPVATIASSRLGEGERIGVTPGGAANDRQDDDTDEQPAPRVGSGNPTPGTAPPREPSSVAPEAAAAKRSEASTIPDLEGLSWQMAPIRWTGNTGTQVTSFIGDDGATVTGIRNDFNVTANSYIVAPWLGQWNAGFGRSTGSSTSSGTGVKVKSDSESNSISGGVSLVPTSDFPFSAQASHTWSDARVGSRGVGLGSGNGDASATSFQLNQRLRANEGRDNYSVSYSSTNLRSGNEKNDFSSLRGDYSGRREYDYEHFLEGIHNVFASFAYVPETAVTNGGKGNLIDGQINHDWKVHEDLSINNRLQMRSASLDLLQGNSLQRNDSTFLLGNTSFSWRPFEEEPLYLSGGATLWHINTDTGIDTPIEQDSLSAYLSASYSFNKNLTASAGISASTTTSNQTGTASSSGSSRFSNLAGNLGVSYSGDPLPLGSFSYIWNLGGFLDSRFDSPGDSSLGANATASHTLFRTIVIDPSQSVGLSFAQGGFFGTRSDQGSTMGLTHNASATWSKSLGDGFSMSLATNAAHAISSDDISDNNQTMSLGATGSLNYRYQFSPRANATVSGTLNWYHTKFDNVESQTLNQVKIDDNETSYNANLIATYSHIAPFSVPNLDYLATLTMNFNEGNSGVTSTSLGGVNSSTRFGRNITVQKLDTSTTLQQNLRYRVGRLSFTATASVINTGGSTYYSLFGWMNREFNGFFDGRW